MKRKLINYDAFKEIKGNSLLTAENELMEAEDILAKALRVNNLKVYCFGENAVTYKTPGNSYVHASYRITPKDIIFENIEELVVDDDSARKEARTIVANMVEEILNKNNLKANEYFSQYMSIPSIRQSLLESTMKCDDSPKKKVKDKIEDEDKGEEKKDRKKKFNFFAKFKKEPKIKKMVKEWKSLVENVFGYIDFQEFGPVMKESEIKQDDKGNVVAVRIPVTKLRNEAKILNLTYKHMLDTDLKILRGKMKKVDESNAFCHAISDLYKCHAVVDEKSTQEVLEAMATKWPDFLYLTQDELAKKIGTALEAVNISKFDDNMCNFFAEAILRTTSELFGDRVQKIAGLANAKLPEENVYEAFQEIVKNFFPHIDESLKLETKVFVDLYNALVDVYQTANQEGNELITSEANDYLSSLYEIISQDREPNLDLAEEISAWLANLVESNLPGAEENWDVSNTPHQTVNGDNPRMNWAAKQDGVPSKFSGDWGSEAPVSDGKSYKGGLDKEMRDNAWGNCSDKDVYPDLSNPYLLKPFGDYKMKEPSAADSGTDDWSRWQSQETWPNLTNPNQKASPWDKMKMNSDDLVVDK